MKRLVGISCVLRSAMTVAVFSLGLVVAVGQAQAADSISESVETLNVLIDKIASEAERVGQRTQMKSLANYLTQPNYVHAQRIAQSNKFSAPSPAIRAQWKTLAALLSKAAAKHKKEAEETVAEFFANLDKIWAAKNSKEIQPYVESLAKLPRTGMDQTSQNRLNGVRNVLNQWYAMLAASEQGRNKEAVDQLNRLMQYNHGAVRIPAEMLLAKRKALHAKMAVDVEKYIAAAKKRIEAAKTADDAERVQMWMQQENIASAATSTTPGFNKAHALTQFVQRWQKALRSEESGNLPQVQNELRYMQSDRFVHSPLVRDWVKKKTAEIAKRVEVEQKKKIAGELVILDKAIEATKSADKLAAVLKMLQSISRTSTQSSELRAEIYALQGDVQNLAALHQSVAKHDMSKVGYWLQRRPKLAKHRWAKWSAQFERQLALEAIASTGQLKNLNPRDGETIVALLLRTADEAVSKGDWQRVYRLLDMYKSLYGSQVYNQSWLRAELAGTQAYMLGQSYEKAGDVASAIHNYREVLKHTAARVPRKDAEERLALLKKKHPKQSEPKASGTPATEKPGAKKANSKSVPAPTKTPAEKVPSSEKQ
jgi:hypothetical protein